MYEKCKVNRDTLYTAQNIRMQSVMNLNSYFVRN